MRSNGRYAERFVPWTDYATGACSEKRGINPSPFRKGEKLESAEARAERILARELKRLRWQECDLESRRNGDPEKVRLVACLRKETTVTLKWIAKRLHMGTWTHVSNRLHLVQ